MADHSCRTMTQPTLPILGPGTVAVSSGLALWPRHDADVPGEVTTVS